MPPKKDKNEPKSINEILAESFLREFNNARKQYEAEIKQKPFCDKTHVCLN